MAAPSDADPRLPVNRVLSLHHLSVLRAAPTELVDAAAAAGFSHCGIRLVSPDTGDYSHGVVEDRRARRHLVRRCAERGVTVLDVEAVWLRPASDISTMHPVLEAAAELGARHLLTVGHDHERGRLVDNLGRLADLAGLEDILPDRLPYAQICDGRAEPPHGEEEALRQEARTDRLCPGEGDLDLLRLIAALPPQIPLSVEASALALAHLSPTEAARRYAAPLTRLLDQARLAGPHTTLQRGR